MYKLSVSILKTLSSKVFIIDPPSTKRSRAIIFPSFKVRIEPPSKIISGAIISIPSWALAVVPGLKIILLGSMILSSSPNCQLPPTVTSPRLVLFTKDVPEGEQIE